MSMKNFVFKILFVFLAMFEVCIPAFSSKYYIDGLKNYNSTNFIDYEEYPLNTITSFYQVNEKYYYYAQKKQGSIEAENAFIEVVLYYSKFINKQNELINLNNIFDSKDDEFMEYRNSLYIMGLTMWYDNNNCRFIMSNKYIYENLAPYLSKEWQELLKYETYFDKQIIFNGKYTISKSEVEQIIKFYKDFAKKYPEFAKKHGINKRIKLFTKSLKRYPNTNIGGKI